VRRGIGLSCTFHGAGFTGNGEVWLAGKLAVEPTASGGVRILTGSTDIGQGTRTIFPQIAAEALGIDIERIEMATPDTWRVPDSGPTVASRTCMVVGKLVEDACLALIDKMRALTAENLGVDLEGLDYRDGAYHWNDGTGARSIELAEVVRREREKGAELRVQVEYQDRDQLEWDGDHYRGDAYPCYAWSTVVTEVEVDMDSYVPRVTRFTTAADVGKAINPVLVEGQIEGGSLQGLGYASMEEVRMENGRYLNHRMTDCIIPTALDAPEMDVSVLEFPYRHGPHGAKGIGEMPMDLPAPSMVAAMEQATGAHIDALPCTPERLAELLSDTGEE
jgi:CO/xanthine dehydrogenase Mo-binding subunit